LIPSKENQGEVMFHVLEENKAIVRKFVEVVFGMERIGMLR